MKIISKHVLKNIFGKPGRTLLVLFCITLCSFIALMSFDLTDSIRNMVMGMMSQLVGTSDIFAEVDEEIDFNDPKYPANVNMCVKQYNNVRYVHDEETYYIANPKYITAYTMDLDTANQMKILQTETTTFADGECVVSDNYLEFYDAKIGDMVIMKDKSEEEHEYKIVGTASNLGQLFQGFTVIITDNDMEDLNPSDNNLTYFVDFEDNSVARGIFDQLREDYPRGIIQCVAENDEMEAQISSITRIFMLLLAICILMVIFVTISVSDRVICERMAVIGTLRSLGFSRNMTTGVIIAENVVYGLIGSLIGIGLYSMARMPILTSMFTINASTGLDLTIDYGSVSALRIIVVILCAIFIECACSIKEILKAVNTPIRDIIFSTKDAEYRFNKVSTIIGLVCVALAVVMLFIKEVFICQIIAIVCVELAVSMLAPYFFTLVGKGLSSIFEKNGKIIPSLAAKETYTKKNTVGASVLIATVVSLCIVVMCFSTSQKEEMSKTEIYTADVYVDAAEDAASVRYINNLPGVTDVEYFRSDVDTMTVNGKYLDLVDVVELKDGGYKYIDIEDMPANLADDEIGVSTALLKKCGLKVGESYEFEFLTDMAIPYKQTLKVAYTQTDNMSSVIINESLYSKLYDTNVIGRIFVKCDDPDKVADTIRRYSDLDEKSVVTRDERIQTDIDDSKQMIVIINVILVIGCGVTFIGAAGNLLIGFESRKRESAVLLSTSLTRKKLSGAYLLESFFASLSAIIFAVPIGFFLLIPIKNIFNALDFATEFSFDFGSMALTLILMLIAFTLTSVQPIRALRKMKLAEQLKYE